MSRSGSPWAPGRLLAPPGQRLESWKEIAVYLKRDVRTVQRWERTKELPVRREPGGEKARVYALKPEIDSWWNNRGLHLMDEEGMAAAGDIERKHGNRGWILAAAALGLVAVAGAIAWRHFATRSIVAPLRVVPLTSYSGGFMYPSFSPDGREVVFSWNGESQDNYDIYVKLLGAGEPQRLTRDPAVDAWASWSADGRHIFFGRWRPGRPGIQLLMVPARGGSERLLGEEPYSDIWPVPAVSWTPDSQWVIMGTVEPPPTGLFLFSTGSWERRRLTTAPLTSRGDHSPVISPDGKKVAFLRHRGSGDANVFLFDLDADYTASGQPRQLTHEPCCVSNPMWTGDGREILYVKDADGLTALYRVVADGSAPPQLVSSLGEVGSFMSIARQGDKLVYAGGTADADIWRVELPSGSRLGGPLSTVRFASSSRVDQAPQIAPDGKRVAFCSNRSGTMEIWVAGADGSSALQVTSLGGPTAMAPRWSPDGSEIVFHANLDGNEDLFVVGANGGVLRRLTQRAGNNSYGSWSRDGRWIYFASNRTGDVQCWKMPSKGGETVQVTRDGGYGGFESPDGRFLYYVKTYVSGSIWRVPVAGGNEELVHESVHSLRNPLNLAMNADGIYTASSPDPLRGFDVQLFRFARGNVESLGRIRMSLRGGISISSDGRWLLFSDQPVRRGDLMLVENFR